MLTRPEVTRPRPRPEVTRPRPRPEVTRPRPRPDVTRPRPRPRPRPQGSRPTRPRGRPFIGGGLIDFDVSAAVDGFWSGCRGLSLICRLCHKSDIQSWH